MTSKSYSPTTLKKVLSVILQSFPKVESNTPDDWLNHWYSQSSGVLLSSSEISTEYTRLN